jgi:hypothetical protein
MSSSGARQRTGPVAVDSIITPPSGAFQPRASVLPGATTAMTRASAGAEANVTRITSPTMTDSPDRYVKANLACSGRRRTALSAERYRRSAANGRGSEATDPFVRCNGWLGSVHSVHNRAAVRLEPGEGPASHVIFDAPKQVAPIARSQERLRGICI